MSTAIRRRSLVGSVFITVALAATAILVAVVGAPHLVDDAGPVPGAPATTARGDAPLLNRTQLTAWCSSTFPGGVAAWLDETWECARFVNGYFRHTPVGNAPCPAGPGSGSGSGSGDATQEPEGLRCARQ